MVTPPPPGRVIACGKSQCHVPDEVCCELHEQTDTPEGKDDGPICVRRSAGEGRRDDEVLACVEATHATNATFWFMHDCDDSGDCAPSELCCTVALRNVSMEASCESASNGQPACPYEETCTDTQPCRTPGTTCIERTCRRVSKNETCGTGKCTGGGEDCCLDAISGKARCLPAGRCPSADSDFECSGAGDCPDGFHCCFNGGFSSNCQADCAVQTYPLGPSPDLLCHADGECPNETPHCKPVDRSACSDDANSCERYKKLRWLKMCR